MRIAMVAHSISNWTPLFARAFQNQGDEVLILSFSPDAIAGVNVEFVGVEPFDARKNKHMFFTSVPRIRRVLRAFAPDIVFAPYLSSNGLSAVLSWPGPTVVSAVGSDVLEHDGRTGLRRLLREAVIRFVCRRADLVNTVSAELDAELIRLGVPAGKLLRLPFGADLREFRPPVDAPRSVAAQLICTRRHERIYDIPTILRGLALAREAGHSFHCTFTSGGTLLAEHRHLAEQLGLADCTTFTGMLQHTELPEYLRAADIYVSASIGDGTSVSLLEAMACGLLPVVSRIPANEPWVRHGRTGMLFDVASPRSLADCIVRAVSDGELRAQAFTHNIDLVRRHGDLNGNLAQLRQRFDVIVNLRRGRRSDATRASG